MIDEIQMIRETKNTSFNPYEYNAGTSLGINIGDMLILASDTRHNSTMGINSRNMSKIYCLDNFYLITTGFYADGYDVYLKMLYSLVNYESKNNKKMKIESVAHLLHNLLYSKRFFPYYAYCILGGYDEKEERFKLYSYDCVGSYGETNCRVDGSGASMIQPLLDSRISKLNWENKEDEDLSIEGVVELIKVAFASTTERDVQTGDFLEIVVVRKDGAVRNLHSLRKD